MKIIILIAITIIIIIKIFDFENDLEKSFINFINIIIDLGLKYVILNKIIL